MQFLEIVPQGFTQAVESMNKISKTDLLKDMAIKVVSLLKGNGLGVSTEEYQQIFQNYEIELKQNEIENVKTCLLFIFQSAEQKEVPASNFPKYLRKFTQITPTNIKCLYEVYEQFSQNTNSKLLSLAKLKNIEWKLSVGIASDSCSDLSSGQMIKHLKTILLI
eukprot:gene7610-11933_t